MKKIRIPLLGLAMSAFVFASCGGSETAETPATDTTSTQTPDPAMQAPPVENAPAGHDATTSVSANKDGASVEDKSGTTIEANKNGASISTANGTEVKTGKDGASLRTPGTEVKTDGNKTEVKAGGLKVKVN